MTSPKPDIETIRDFVYREAALIDNKQLNEWYELFTEDAIYWMPLTRGQGEEDIHNALFFEDKLLLKVRIERLKHPRAFSQSPPSFCQHVLQQPNVTQNSESGMIETSTPFAYYESQEDVQISLAGTVHHMLQLVDGVIRIYRKRIELLNRGAALPSIQLFL